MREGGLDIENDFVRFNLRDFCIETSNSYPELIREFYANVEQWINDDEKDFMWYESVEVKSRMNGMDPSVGICDTIHAAKK